MKLVEDKEKGLVSVGGNLTIEGHVVDPDDCVCEKCNSNVIYYDKYDAVFCPNCNYWFEQKCDDQNCRYCMDRPETPMPNI